MTRSGALGARRRAARGDDGHITLLSIMYAAVALGLVLTVVTATDVHLERKRLLALADGAALAAASALDQDAYYARQMAGGADGGSVLLTDPSVHDAVDEHLAAAPGAARFTDVQVVGVATSDGRTVEVTLGALARPALLTAVTAPWSDGIALRVTTSARAW